MQQRRAYNTLNMFCSLRQIESLAATNAAQLQAAKDAERVLMQRIHAALEEASTAATAATAADERAAAAQAAAEAAEAATAAARAEASAAVDALAAANVHVKALEEEVGSLRAQLAAAGARLAAAEGELRVAMEGMWQREEECRALQVGVLTRCMLLPSTYYVWAPTLHHALY